MNLDETFLGVFDCVRNQVDQDLLDPIAIREDEFGKFWLVLMDEFNIFHLRLESKDTQAFLNQVKDIDLLVHIQDNLLFFKLSEIQDIIHKEEHQVGAVLGNIIVCVALFILNHSRKKLQT